MAKADQFYMAAETIATTIEDQHIADAYVTLCVHAGIVLSFQAAAVPRLPSLTVARRRSPRREGWIRVK
jgi:hypothetical protein